MEMILLKQLWALAFLFLPLPKLSLRPHSPFPHHPPKTILYIWYLHPPTLGLWPHTQFFPIPLPAKPPFSTISYNLLSTLLPFITCTLLYLRTRSSLNPRFNPTFHIPYRKVQYFFLTKLVQEVSIGVIFPYYPKRMHTSWFHNISLTLQQYTQKYCRLNKFSICYDNL